MTTVIPQRELRNQNAAIIDAVAGGESFVITRNGTPVAELRPIAGPQHTFVSKAQIAAVAARSGRIDATQFRADLDSVIDQSL